MKPYFETDLIKLYHGDCREILPQLPSTDVLISDPPNVPTGPYPDNRFYETMLHSIADAKATTKWILAKVNKFNQTILFRFLADRAHEVRDVGAWVKPNGERLEFLFCLSKTLIEIKGEFPAGHLFHAGNAEYNSIAFPEVLPKEILERFGGKSVVDPCAGTGTTLRVAKKLGVSSTGIEIDEKRCEKMAMLLDDSKTDGPA